MHGAERERLAEEAKRAQNWKRWGPYLSERQWGTVREDYSADGEAWRYFPHDHARSRAYRWGEDGLLGWCDRECRLCFAITLWNGQDPILKERLFGLANAEGNHGEDVKECYFYLDSTPTHSYAKALYKYPQAAFPYDRLLQENARRGKADAEFELLETRVFDDDKYFDVQVEYAKASADETLIRLTISNRASSAATIHALPTLWFRNTWSWGCTHEGCSIKPHLEMSGDDALLATHPSLGAFRFEIDHPGHEFLFTENETDLATLYSTPNASPFTKNAFHEFVVQGRREAVNSRRTGTKAAAHLRLEIPAHESVVVQMRLLPDEKSEAAPFHETFSMRSSEADDFYKTVISPALAPAEGAIVRQAYAGLLWSKQFYHYVIKDWLAGDPGMPPPPPGHAHSRNEDWLHLFNSDVISMPDKWEYPWFAAWDLAFHMIPFSRIDPDFSKQQLLLFLREWYMHPSGQLPAYEWDFSDVNPPVHAWACWRAYKITAPAGQRDTDFLERTFQKLLLNFTWWVNRKDVQGRHIFAGGFLGLDNIGLFDRSKKLPTGQSLAQADGTAWMAFYSVTMLSMAVELARTRPPYEDIASKFFEHFVDIVDAMNTLGGTGLWDEQDGFYYDQLLVEGRAATPLRVRSMVGIIPLLAVEVLDQETVTRLPGFRKRLRWFIKNRADLAEHISYLEKKDDCGESHVTRRLLSIPSRDRLVRVLRYVLDENEFLSPHGIRSLSRVYKDHPYSMHFDGTEVQLGYEPAESQSNLFGGNSNWRGPVWFPINYLLIEALERYHHFYGESLLVEFPTGSGTMLNLGQVAHELAHRLSLIFLPAENGARPWAGGDARFATDPNWRDLTLFHEYFDGETGRGLGASHQTGWTALITRCLGMIGKLRE